MTRRQRSLGDLDDDIRDHIERETADNVERGMSPDEARAAALRAFGSVAIAREDARAVWIPLWIDQAGQDMRYALRTFGRAPGFTAIVVFTLALGIGATTAIASVVTSLLLTPPPFPRPDRLVTVFDTHPTKAPPDVDVPPSPGNFLDWRERARSFESMAGWRNWYYAVSSVDAGRGTPETVRGVKVSATFFPALGVEPALGRLFGGGEEVPGADRVVLLADPLWRRRFGADPSIVGRAILVDGRPSTVVGVLPRDFQFYQADLELWMPLPMTDGMRARANHSMQVFGRLAPGVTLAAAQQEMDAIAAQIAREHPDTNDGWGARLVPLYPTRETRDLKPALLVLLGASGFVLLIACVNVANLLYARAIARRREMAVRVAIGASRSRLLRQMIAEASLLAAAGAAAGLALALWAIPPFAALLPHADTNKGLGQFGQPMGTLDARMLAIASIAAIGTGLLFGLAPALQSTHADGFHPFRSTPRAAAKRALIAAELALSIVLLVGAALLVESFWRLQQVSPGFRADHLLTMQLSLPRGTYPGASEVRAFYDRLRRAVDALPGVTGSAAVSYRPFLGMAMGAVVDVEGQPRRNPDDNFVRYAVITPGYLHVLGQPLLQGRDVADADEESSEPVAVINKTMADRLWPNQNPIGRRLRPEFARTEVPWAVDAPARWLTVVGVAADIKEFRLDERPGPLLYVAHRQFPFAFMYPTVRTAVPPETLAPAVQQAIASIDRDQPVSNVRTMDDAIARAVPRFQVALLGVFAGVALLLSAVGVYGVMSYVVGQRTQEIGIRMALGSSPRRVVMAMMRDVAAFGVAGTAIGLAAAFGLTRVMASMLFGVSPGDPRAFGGAALVLLVVALGACYVPARRATRVDPTVALRCE